MGRENEIACGDDLADRDKSGLRRNVVAAEEIEAVELVAGNEALDLVEDSERIEGAEARLKAVGGEPDGVTVGFPGLCAAGLAEVAEDAGENGGGLGRGHEVNG